MCDVSYVAEFASDAEETLTPFEYKLLYAYLTEGNQGLSHYPRVNCRRDRFENLGVEEQSMVIHLMVVRLAVLARHDEARFKKRVFGDVFVKPGVVTVSTDTIKMER